MAGRAQINAGACVLSLLPKAGCEGCAVACPTKALWFEGDGTFMFDPAACTGCAACAAACPAQAIAVAGVFPMPRNNPDRRRRLACVCPQRGGGTCAQALGLEALAALWRDGVREIVLHIGACATCPNGKGLDLTGPLARINRLLASRGLPQMRLHQTEVLSEMPRLDRPELPNLGRRGVLLALSDPATEAPALETLQRQGTQADALFAHAPRINPERCTACNACIRICPTSTMTLIKAGQAEAAYTTDPAACTGCGLCGDICDEGAVTIHTMIAAPEDVALHPWRCMGCGVSCHSLVAGGPAEGLCPICHKTGHHRRLHWVQT
jgi:ferredoxin